MFPTCCTDNTCQLTFKRMVASTQSYDSRPRHVAVGDFNNDNHLDLAVANSGTDNIGILMGYGNATFANQIIYLTGLGSRPYFVAVGDFNNDKQLDIAVANYGTNSIGILIGRANRTFTSQIIFSLGPSRPLSLAVGDFNNDNRSDIAVVNYGTSNVAILLGLGNGSFRMHRIYYMGFDSIPYSIAVADFNNDKQLDMAIANYGTSNLVILLADTNETFVSHLYSTGKNSHPCSVAVGDFNHDNKIDIAIASYGTNNLNIFLGHGNGTFNRMMEQSLGLNSGPTFIAVGDFDNDTELDLVIANSESGNIFLLKGNGNGTFSIAVTHSTGYNSDPCSIAVGDFDHDNKLDVAIANNGSNSILVLNAYIVYINTSQTIYQTGEGSFPNSVAVGDFNKDNNLDIVVVNRYSNNIGIFINLGDGTFADQKTYFIADSTEPYFAAIGDFNNDQNSDIVVVLSGVSALVIFTGYGDGTFGYGYAYSTGFFSYPRCVAVGDFNNDGNLDIVTANYFTGDAGVFLGSGDGRFQGPVLYSTGDDLFTSFVAVGDFNNDNFLDFAAANYFSTTITIHLGYGNGAFQDPIFLSASAFAPSCIAVGDLNNDNQLDIVFANPLYSNVGILFGYGNGSFGSINTYSTGSGSYPWSIALGDFNNDTILDIAVTNVWDFSIGLLLGYGNGMFATQRTFSTGYVSIPQSIAIGNFDNDDQTDIVVGNSAMGNIGVFLIQDEKDFTSETSYSTGSSPHPYSVAVGDFNNNSHLDITVANSGNDNLQILLHYDRGIFLNKTTYSTGLNSHPQHVIVADFNKDKQLDIAATDSWNDSIEIVEGFGNGMFDTGSRYSTGSGSFPSSIAAADFNNDSWIDIVVANQGADNVGVFLGFDYAVFASYDILLTTRVSMPDYVVVADFNNDSQWDLAVANKAVGTIDVLLGYGNGSFAAQMMNSVGSLSAPFSMAVGDFNNDNRVDIAVADSSHSNISVLLGYGNGTFAHYMSYSTGSLSSVSIAVGDFNNDGNLDLVFTNQNDNNVGIFLGYGNGTFPQQISYLMPDKSNPVWVAVSDFNNDTILDIAVANFDGNTVSVIIGHGDGTFRNITTYSTGNNSSPCSIAVGDFNEDSSMDIAVANQNAQNIGIFFGYGNGTFSSQTTYSTGLGSVMTSIIVGDLNKDSVLDILVTDYGSGNGNIGVLYGYGDGNFTLLQIYSTGVNSNPTSVAIGDFDNDNRADLAVANSNTVTIGIMLQDKTKPFGTQTIFPIGSDSSPTSVAVGDFNNDNRLDIAVANSGTNNIGVLLGLGDGTFDQQKVYSTGNYSGPSSIAVGDFNNDSQLDIAVANSNTNNIGIFLGLGNGTFAVMTTFSTGISSNPSSVTVGDLNKDNQLDLVVANSGISSVLIFYGYGNGTFTNPKSYSFGYDTRPQSVTIGDFNNDSLLDIAVAVYGTGDVEILLQTC
jgi:hypothetical protein